MKKSLPISRKFSLKDCANGSPSDKLLPARLLDVGISNVQIDRNKLEVTYDQQVYKFSEIVQLLLDSGFKIEKGFLYGFKSFWLDYLDTVARENASAPPPSCCNKPPRKGQAR